MRWVTVWGNAPSVSEHRPETYAKNITLRYPLTSAFGGEKVRLHFSNFCGTEPVTLTQVTIANAVTDREITLHNARLVTFIGEESVTIPAGEEVFSDEIIFRIKPRGAATVSIYLGDFTLMRTGVVITGPLSKGFFSVGNHTFDRVLPLECTRTTNTFYFLSGMDVYTDDCNRAVVLYGDSITAQSWADYLALKCMDDPYNTTAIVRRAASGTRVLREYSCITYESYGLCGRNRFEREISTVSGADAVIIQQGINDIIHPVGTEVNPFRPMSDLPTVEELEEGIKYYLDLAKKYGLKTWLGTLLPIYGWRTYAPFRDQMKNSFNDWIRSSAPCDGVVDFDSALRSEENPSAFRQGYDSGDHLHPSEAAYKAMAELAFEKVIKEGL
ncbi:MAG: SGNH/GDSL hydrolase family protein [Candidatus Coproplasma sp.]